MEQEREVRYKVDKVIWDSVLSVTEPLKPKMHTLDITFGAYGFNSLERTGRIFRIRQKESLIALEIKRRTSENSWLEEKIKLESVKQGFSFLKLSGLEPYLYLERNREIRKYKNLIICLDDFELLGKFVEIEFQNSNEAELNEFLNICKIHGEPQALYGDIVKSLLETNADFKNSFEIKLSEVIS